MLNAVQKINVVPFNVKNVAEHRNKSMSTKRKKVHSFISINQDGSFVLSEIEKRKMYSHSHFSSPQESRKKGEPVGPKEKEQRNVFLSLSLPL